VAAMTWSRWATARWTERAPRTPWRAISSTRVLRTATRANSAATKKALRATRAGTARSPAAFQPQWTSGPAANAVMIDSLPGTPAQCQAGPRAEVEHGGQQQLGEGRAGPNRDAAPRASTTPGRAVLLAGRLTLSPSPGNGGGLRRVRAGRYFSFF